MSPLRIRRRRGGSLGLIPVVIIIAVIVVAALALAGVFRDPTGAMNDCGGKAVSFARATGSYSVSGFGGHIAGQFDSLKVDVTAVNPGSQGGLDLSVLNSIFGHKGTGYVKTTVTGPGGVTIGAWKSTVHDFDISLVDQATGASQPGDFVSGVACFPQSGVSTWHFELQFDDGNGHWVLATQDRTVNV